MVCKKCGTEIVDGGCFCPSCGLPCENENKKTICISCGKEVAGNQNFCPFCGKTLKNVPKSAENCSSSDGTSANKSSSIVRARICAITGFLIAFLELIYIFFLVENFPKAFLIIHLVIIAILLFASFIRLFFARIGAAMQYFAFFAICFFTYSRLYIIIASISTIVLSIISMERN